MGVAGGGLEGHSGVGVEATPDCPFDAVCETGSLEISGDMVDYE